MRKINQQRLATTQKKIIKTYKNNVLDITNLLTDIFSINLLYKYIDKLVDKMYLEINDIIMNELVSNINRNYGLLMDIAEITKEISNQKINMLLMNEHTNHTIMFELTRNKRRLKNSIHRIIRQSVDEQLKITDAQNEIRNMVFRKSYGQVKGDCYKTLRIFTTEETRIRTNAKLEAITTLENRGYKITRTWWYTWRSKEQRIAHVHADGMPENEEGYFVIHGYRTKGPGLFGIPSEDINCKCDTECIIETVR